MDCPSVIGNYQLYDCLGSGFSGSIFHAKHIHTGQSVALKVQNTEETADCPTNLFERHLYPTLQGGIGMPTLFGSGVQDIWDYLAISLLGKSLDSLHRKSGKTAMDLSTVCTIAIQVIDRLEFMHAKGILHRDIQLGNCVVGLPPHEKTIYMIDFGFSKRYIDPSTKQHIPDSKAKRDFIGNYWFSSVGVHCKGRVPSRRDDLEAAALMFIHMLTPLGLSWTRNGIPKTDEAHDRLKREKRHAKPQDLCQTLPEEFEEFLRYTRKLKFMEKPDYDHWKDAFRDLAAECGFPDSTDFIWPPKKYKSVLLPTYIAPPPPPARPKAVDDQIEETLRGLANMRVEESSIIGDEKSVAQAVEKAKRDAKKSTATNPSQSKEIISVSDISDNPIVPKAQRLLSLRTKIGGVADNEGLAACVFEFVAILRSTNSRILTKEGFLVLNALHKQLADPSVFIPSLRTSRTRSTNNAPGEEHAPPKLGVLARLRADVSRVKSNKDLAKMVADFGEVTNKSSNRGLTKDGFAFLDGVGVKLQGMH